MRRRARELTALVLVLLAADRVAAQVTYGPNGLSMATPEGGFTAAVGLRNQVRFTTPFTVVPTEPGEIGLRTGDDIRLKTPAANSRRCAFSHDDVMTRG